LDKDKKIIAKRLGADDLEGFIRHHKANVDKYPFPEFKYEIISSKGINKDEIKLSRKGGVYYLPVKANGLDWDIIFDTGASSVSISLTELMYMVKHNLIDENDILGAEFYQIADGSIEEGTAIIIKELEIGGFTLKNIRASVSHTIDAPMLLGQSALQRFSTVTVDNDRSVLILNQ
jgi:aspartyl protease family protein